VFRGWVDKRSVPVQVQAEDTFAGRFQDHFVLSAEPVECILGPFALGDVADHTREQPFPVLMGFAKGHFDREFTAVFAQPYELGRAAHHARFARSQVTVQASHTEIPVSFGHKQRDRLPNDLFCPVAEDTFRPAVEPAHYPVGRYGHDRVEGRVQYGTVTRLALS